MVVVDSRGRNFDNWPTGRGEVASLAIGVGAVGDPHHHVAGFERTTNQ
jgi:hypothetical protein